MGNTLNYTIKAIEYGYKLPDNSTRGTVAELRSVPVRFSLTFHDLDQDQLNRLLAIDHSIGLINSREADAEADADAEAERQCDEYYDYSYGLPVK